MRNFLTILGLFCMINLTFAQQTVIRNGHYVQTCSPRTVSISANDVQFWVGSGSNSTLVCIGWDDASAGYTPTVVVWGLHWNGSIYLIDALDSIAAYDSRFTYSISSGYVGSVDYNDPVSGIHLSPSMHYNCNNYGSAYSSTTLTTTWLRISESTCNDYNFSTVNTLIYASDPNAGPTDATISASDITYWVGTGSTEVIFVGNWCNPDVALAWGVRFQGDSTTVKSVMDTIQTYDNRFGYSGMYSTIDEVTYQDGTYNLIMSQPTTGYIMYNVNGTLANWGFSDMYVHQGDLIKVGNTDCATATGDPNDWTTWGYAWETPIVPATPLTPPSPPAPIEATIAFSDILYWVGEGSNEAVMAVNWADTALAWGYRWNGTATVADMMTAIAAADPRFSYTASGLLDDINYIDTAAGMTTPLGITPGNYWSSTKNGFMDMGLGQTLDNGDFEKWADPAAGIIIDSTYDATYNYWWYTYVYPMTITPVTVPATTHSGISSRETTRVIAYPNPCTGTLHIVSENANRVELYSVDGRLLKAVECLGSQTNINMRNYPAGLYWLKVGNNIQKILKK